MSKRNRTGDELAETSWRQEARAMADAAAMARRVGMSLPEDSKVRAAFLTESRRWALGARLRGIEVV
jgi:hypothetical protein